MKWLVGPRAIGKTYQLIQEVLKRREEHLILMSFNPPGARQLMQTFLKIVEKEGQDLLGKEISLSQRWVRLFDGDMWRQYYFESPESLTRHPDRKRHPKFIDNADIILENFFGNVQVVTGTGPNFSWKENVREEWFQDVMWRARDQMSLDVWLEQFSQEWSND